QLGSALGVALVSSVLSIVGPLSVGLHGVVQPNLTAYHAAFLTSALLVLIAACIALTIHDRDAAATMRRASSKEVVEQPVIVEM
ncbi:MAG: MFS transporter, partial [Ktedonobacteraceae bacterium]